MERLRAASPHLNTPLGVLLWAFATALPALERTQVRSAGRRRCCRWVRRAGGGVGL